MEHAEVRATQQEQAAGEPGPVVCQMGLSQNADSSTIPNSWDPYCGHSTAKGKILSWDRCRAMTGLHRDNQRRRKGTLECSMAAEGGEKELGVRCSAPMPGKGCFGITKHQRGSYNTTISTCEKVQRVGL